MTPDLQAILVGFRNHGFPVELCTFQNLREPEVFDSQTEFLCVVVDCRWPDRATILPLKPYVAKDPETGTLLYGWTDGDAFFDHFERAVHEDNARVVAWRSYEQVKFGPSSW